MWVKQFRVSGQTGHALALGLLLYSLANEDGYVSGTSDLTLATMLGVSVRTLRRYLSALQGEGWVTPALITERPSIRLAAPRK